MADNDEILEEVENIIPSTRIEQYLAKLCGFDVDIPDEPLSRVEYYLNELIEGGGVGTIEFFTEEEWDALTLSEKKEHQLVGIIKNDSKYYRGDILYGEEAFIDLSVNVLVTYNESTQNSQFNIPISKNVLIVVAQSIASNGNSYSYSLGGLNPILSGEDDNARGNFAVYYGPLNEPISIYSRSTGNNWNNESAFVAEFPKILNIIESKYDCYGINGYNYQYHAESDITLFAYVVTGGQNYTVSLTKNGNSVNDCIVNDHAATGTRHNTLYKFELHDGDLLSFSAPSSAASSSEFLFLLINPVQ